MRGVIAARWIRKRRLMSRRFCLRSQLPFLGIDVAHSSAVPTRTRLIFFALQRTRFMAVFFLLRSTLIVVSLVSLIVASDAQERVRIKNPDGTEREFVFDPKARADAGPAASSCKVSCSGPGWSQSCGADSCSKGCIPAVCNINYCEAGCASYAPAQ